jgi:hypothetical protein
MSSSSSWLRFLGGVTVVVFAVTAVFIWTGLGEAVARDINDDNQSLPAASGGVPVIVFVLAAGFAAFAIYQGVMDHYKKMHKQDQVDKDSLVIPLKDDQTAKTPENPENTDQKASAHSK